MLVSPPSVLPMLLARAVGPGPAVLPSAWAPALAVPPPSVLLMLLSVAGAARPGPAVLASVWAPALVLSAARAPALAGLLPMVPGLRPRRARFSPMGRRFAEQPVAPSH
jgi:hypothetical protein